MVLNPRTNLPDRKSTRLNSSHGYISYAVFCLKKKKKTTDPALRRWRSVRPIARLHSPQGGEPRASICPVTTCIPLCTIRTRVIAHMLVLGTQLAACRQTRNIVIRQRLGYSMSHRARHQPGARIVARRQVHVRRLSIVLTSDEAAQRRDFFFFFKCSGPPRLLPFSPPRPSPN